MTFCRLSFICSPRKTEIIGFNLLFILPLKYDTLRIGIFEVFMGSKFPFPENKIIFFCHFGLQLLGWVGFFVETKQKAYKISIAKRDNLYSQVTLLKLQRSDI